MTPYTPITYRFTINSKREDINIFLRSTNGSCKICLDSSCTNTNVLETFKGTQKKVYTYEEKQYLLDLDEFYIQVSSTTNEQLILVAQHGIVIQNGKFDTSSLDTQFVSKDKYQFMKFIGNTDGLDVEITTDREQNVAILCYNYDGKTQNQFNIEHNISVGDNSFNLNQQQLGNYPGYCFFEITGNSKIWYTYQYGVLSLNQKQQTLHNFPFAESTAHSRVLIDTTQFQQQDYQLSIVATSDSPSIYKYSTIYVSQSQFYGYDYDSQGNKVFQDEHYYITYTGGLNLNNENDSLSDQTQYQYCEDDTHCYLYISSSFDTVHFYLTNIESYYQPLQVNAFVLENANFIEPQNYDQYINAIINKKYKTYIFNMGLIYSSLMNNSIGEGYTFSLIYNDILQMKAIINVNSIATTSGVYLSSSEDKDQIKQVIISPDINKEYYVLDQMYFLMISDVQQEGIQFTGMLSYQIDDSRIYNIQNLQSSQDVALFANTQKYKKQYQVCFTWTDGPDNLSIYVSNKYEIPSDIYDSFDVFNDTVVTLASGAKQVCCTNEIQDSYWAYMRIQNFGNETVQGYVTFGDSLQTYASLQINQLQYLTFYKDYPYIKTVSQYFTDQAIATTDYYFEVTYDQPLTEKAVIQFIDQDTNVMWYQLSVEQGQTYCSCIFEAPANKQLVIQMTEGNNNQYEGQYYMGQIINEKEILHVMAIQDYSVPAMLFKYQPYEYQYPIIQISKQNYNVDKLIAFICEEKPQLVNSGVDDKCYKIEFTGTKFDNLILPLDLNYTTSILQSKYKDVVLSSQPYYITLFLKEPTETIIYYAVEVYYAQTLQSNQVNGLKLVPSTSASIYNVNWFSLDMLAENKEIRSLFIYSSFDQVIDQICVTLDGPMSYLEFKQDESRCIQKSEAVQQISIEIDASPFQAYRRIFLNLMLDAQQLNNVQQIQCSSFKELRKTESNSTVYIGPKITRAGEDTLQYYINVLNTKHIQIINQLATNINNYNELIQQGTSKYTRLLVSDYQDLSLENSEVDDTIALQIIDKQLKWQNFQFVQIQAATVLTEEIGLRISVYADKTIQMTKLDFLKQYNQYNIPAEQLNSLYFEASHTPAYITYEICSAKQNGVFSSYSSPVVVQPSLRTICDNQTTILDDKFNGYIIQYLPVEISDSDKYTNINYFFSTQFNESEISYQVVTSDGILRPVLPSQQEVYVTKVTPKEYELLFRPAILPQILDYGMEDNSSAYITYSVYVVNKSSITDTTILKTLCGLELVGQKYSTFQSSDFTSEQLKLEIYLDNVNEDSYVILAAQSSINDLASIYNPVTIQFSTNTVNQTALICGIVFGILGVIIIGVAIFFIIKYSKAMKQRQYYKNYENIQQ